jgi:hypothetical protein
VALFPLLELCRCSYCQKLCLLSRCWSFAFIPTVENCAFVPAAGAVPLFHHKLTITSATSFTLLLQSFISMCVFLLKIHHRHTSSLVTRYMLLL